MRNSLRGEEGSVLEGPADEEDPIALIFAGIAHVA